MKLTETFKASKGSAKGRSTKKVEPVVPSSRGVAPVGAAPTQEQQQQHDNEQDEAILRQFDLNSKFGPCAGMSRLERYERAVKLGLDPPPHIKDLVLRHGEGSMFNRNLWEHPY